MVKIHVIIPASGFGKRFNAAQPKQFEKIQGNSIISLTESKFAQVDLIDKIFLIGDRAFEKNFIQEKFHSKTKVIYAAGEQRAQTVLNGLKYLNDVEKININDWVIVHDAVRPNISVKLIKSFINKIIKNDVGGIMAIRESDTVKLVDKNFEIQKTINRANLWRAQTPQMFKLGLLLEGFNRFQGNPTDESEVIENMNLKPIIFEGDSRNVKITYPEDLDLLKKEIK
ncbi:MAG: 2-C-methyl-D-erythritol 4-phosphate cytidylyltransferase [Nitrosomonadales bacterium]|jgi:2-C-methyl-D-erythritol 4-phosphate cytidylyltransferase